MDSNIDVVAEPLASEPQAIHVALKKRRTMILIPAIALIACAAGFGADRLRASLPSSEAPPSATIAPSSPSNIVQVAPVELHNMDLQLATSDVRSLVQTVHATGTVAFNDLRTAQVAAPARGRIQFIEVAAGQPVHAGQRLASFDNFDLGSTRSQIAAADASLVTAVAEATAAQAAFTRAMDLVRIGVVTRSEVERRRADLARADAVTRTRQAELQQWKETEQRQMPAPTGDDQTSNVAHVMQGPANSVGMIIAPFSGVIDAVRAAPGDLVDTSRQIFTVADLSTVWVQADVAERDLGVVHVGDAVSLSVEAYSGRTFIGRVVYIPDEIDPRTGTARVRCEVPNEDDALRVNMFGKVDIASPLDRKGIMVPDAALQEIDGKPVVFTPAGPDRFERHIVRLGLHSDGFTEIVEGLSPNENIVTEGSFWLKAALTQSSIPDNG